MRLRATVFHGIVPCVALRSSAYHWASAVRDTITPINCKQNSATFGAEQKRLHDYNSKSSCKSTSG